MREEVGIEVFINQKVCLSTMSSFKMFIGVGSFTFFIGPRPPSVVPSFELDGDSLPLNRLIFEVGWSPKEVSGRPRSHLV